MRPDSFFNYKFFRFFKDLFPFLSVYGCRYAHPNWLPTRQTNRQALSNEVVHCLSFQSSSLERSLNTVNNLILKTPILTTRFTRRPKARIVRYFRDLLISWGTCSRPRVRASKYVLR